MAHQLQAIIADQRPAAGLRWLSLQAPELARAARPGQFLLVRCAEEGSFDPLLRRALFVSAVEEALGQVALLYEPSDRGLLWLSRGRPGDPIDVLGPFGQPFALDRRSRTLLLIGQGPGLAALLFLARRAAARGCSVTLLAGAARAELIPPPFLLPSEVEYQTVVGPVTELLPEAAGAEQSQAGKEAKRHGGRGKGASEGPPPPGVPASSPVLIAWADQLYAALPHENVGPLVRAIRATKYRWERGYAAVLLEAPLVCGVGACAVCAVETRRGARMLCSDGPTLDGRDFVEA